MKDRKKLRLSKDTLRQLTVTDVQQVRGGLIRSVFCTVDQLGCGTYLTCVTVCAGHCSTSGD